MRYKGEDGCEIDQVLTFKPIQERLESFLTPTAVAQSGTKPTIADHYGDGYKLVDSFDQLLSFIEYPFQLMKLTEAWFIHTILLLVVNSWAIWNDIQAVDNVDSDLESLREFIEIQYTEPLE